ncbi:MAG TPA: cytochrome c [Terriglobales bacterium]|nr:cytochrome c [Terriglobales bacterium]
MRVIGLFLVAGLMMAQAPSYEAVANTRQIMQGMVDPASRAIAAAAKEPPADDRGWMMAGTQATLLAESMQLLNIGGRAKDHEGWLKASNAMSDAAMAVAKAAEVKDAAAFQSAAANITAGCQGCHRTYRPRPAQKKQ